MRRNKIARETTPLGRISKLRCGMYGYKKLDRVSSARYLEKLKLLGLDERDDPYDPKNAHNFVEDMTKWPAVEHSHIFSYYIQRPGIYTQHQLLQWKSLDAFNYFQSGHVRDIKIWLRPTSQCCIVMAYVNPSQNAPEKAHLAWIGTKFDGEIITLHCSCMAG